MNSMNLLPDSYIKRQFRDRIDMVCIVIFAIVMGGAFLVDRITRTGYDKAHDNYSNATVMSGKASGLTEEFFALQRTKDAMITEAKGTMKMEERIPRSYLLAVITNALPKTVSLTKVQLETKIPEISKDKEDSRKTGMKNSSVQRKSSTEQSAVDVPPEPKPDPVVTVTIEGVSVSENDYDIAEFIRILKGKGLYKKITPLYARQQQSKKSDQSGKEKQPKLREFGIKMELLNNVDVRELIKSDGQKITPSPLMESGNTGIEIKSLSAKGGAAK